MPFSPHITVATIVEENGRFLLVQEHDSTKGLVFNQPAGHLEANEDLLEAALRETLEETAWQVELQHLVGIYLYQAPNGVTYQRACFSAKPIKQLEQSLDPDIEQTVWLTYDELVAQQAACRSPLVLQCIADYQSGSRHSLSVFKGVY